MQREEFESRVRDLLPKVTDKAMAAWTRYAEELDQDGVEPEADHYDENYVELTLVKQHYGEEITTQLFNHGEHFTFNYFELRGAARRLADGWTLAGIEKYTLENGCDATQEEHEEFMETLRVFQKAEQRPSDVQMI